MAKHILVVDDSPVITLLWRLVLENAGYTIAHAHDGPQALKMLLASKYDALIVDYHMGEMDGLELAARVRAMPSYAFKPIVMVTADRNAEVRESARLTGINGWMTKPVNPENLLKTMHQLCPLEDHD